MNIIMHIFLLKMVTQLSCYIDKIGNNKTIKKLVSMCAVMYVSLCECACVSACACKHFCAQKNERLTHHDNFFVALFPDLHFVVIFCSSEFMCRVLLCNGIPPPSPPSTPPFFLFLMR